MNLCKALEIRFILPYIATLKQNALVAQLDRASDYGSEGREFESFRVYCQKSPHTLRMRAFYMFILNFKAR